MWNRKREEAWQSRQKNRKSLIKLWMRLSENSGIRLCKEGDFCKNRVLTGEIKTNTMDNVKSRCELYLYSLRLLFLHVGIVLV